MVSFCVRAPRFTSTKGLVWMAVVLLVILQARTPLALETDQYLAWNRPLADSTEVLNAWFNLRLREIVLKANGQSRTPDCWHMTRAMEKALRNVVVIHAPDDWAENSPLVDRVPGTPEEELAYWDLSIYGDSPPLAPAKLMPLASTIQAAGVRFGIDKLAHFVSVGWLYYKDLHGRLQRGTPMDQATDEVIRNGVKGELIYLLGYRVSGVFSIPDLMADYQGMLFYQNLCSGPDPVLELEEGRWLVRHPIDLRRYISPEWDESYEPIVFSPGRWKGIRPRLEELCPQLDSPWLRELWEHYEQRDLVTPTERVVEELVREGRIPDPGQFTLPAVCGREPNGFGREVLDPPPPPAAEPVSRETLSAVTTDEGQRRRRSLWTWQAGWLEPMGPTVSLGLLQASTPAHSDCLPSCNMGGLFAKATAGPGGGELSLGWATLNGRITRHGHGLDATWLGFSARAAVLRTWEPYSTWRANRTYAGAGLEASIARFSFTLGAMRRIAGGPNDHWLFTWGLAWGF